MDSSQPVANAYGLCSKNRYHQEKSVDIDWYGHACFRIREKGVAIITDPYNKEIGYTLPRIRADVVTVSHSHKGHSYARGFRGSPRVLCSPGEYEIGGTFITGVPTFHDRKQGEQRGQNIVFLFDFDGLTVCHLGDLGHLLSQVQIELLNQVNILLIPVGGISTITAARAAEIVSLLEPNIVIPMHYKIPGLSRNLGRVSRFLKAMETEKVAPLETLRIKQNALPQDTQVVLLDRK
jgi:L-ascorbate metabolism protein UlaG (beta-lactamase superfamily)